jgi:hypothetical protein
MSSLWEGTTLKANVIVEWLDEPCHVDDTQDTDNTRKQRTTWGELLRLIKLWHADTQKSESMSDTQKFEAMMQQAYYDYSHDY